MVPVSDTIPNKDIDLEKVKYSSVTFKIWNTYKIDLIATMTSLLKSSSLFNSEISLADSD